MSRIYKIFIKATLLDGSIEYLIISSHVYSMWYTEMRHSTAKVFQKFEPISEAEYNQKKANHE